MAAFRQSLRGQSLATREDLLKAVSIRLGFQRLGSTIRDTLKGHLRAAIRRNIVGTDGPEYVYAATSTMADYSRDELIDFLTSVIRKGTTITREEAIHAVAAHLGFSRVTKHVRGPLKSAINGAIRRGVLGYDGDLLWRET